MTAYLEKLPLYKIWGYCRERCERGSWSINVARSAVRFPKVPVHSGNQNTLKNDLKPVANKQPSFLRNESSHTLCNHVCHWKLRFVLLGRLRVHRRTYWKKGYSENDTKGKGCNI